MTHGRQGADIGAPLPVSPHPGREDVGPWITLRVARVRGETATARAGGDVSARLAGRLRSSSLAVVAVLAGAAWRRGQPRRAWGGGGRRHGGRGQNGRRWGGRDRRRGQERSWPGFSAPCLPDEAIRDELPILRAASSGVVDERRRPSQLASATLSWEQDVFGQDRSGLEDFVVVHVSVRPPC